MAEANCRGAGLSFHLGEEGRILTAVFQPPDTMAPIDAAWVNQEIASRGLGDLFIFEDALDELVSKYNATSEGFTLAIGERRDGTFSLDIAADLMQATLTVDPPFGGQAVSREQIYGALQEKGIVFGVLDDNIAAAIAQGYVRSQVIAAGVYPVPGRNTQFLSLIPEVRERCPQMADHDTVDFHNLGDIITVKAGDPLMRRVPPTRGEPGKNIRGLPIFAPDGNDVPFQAELTGTACDPNDPDLLVAAISGRPVPVPNGVIVEPVIAVRNVDLSSGNLNVAGTLSISGDVKSGMNVQATGDITIGGVVEAAHVEAGGDIEIKGGIIGQGDVGNKGGETTASIAVIQAHGSVTALYVENARVTAGVDIVLRELAMKSELNAGNRITVGEPGSGKGRIIGGVCHATTRIDAGAAGSRAGVSTRLEVGTDPIIQEKLTSVIHLLTIKEKEREETDKSLAYLRENPRRLDPNMIKEKERVFHSLRTEIQELTGQKRRLQKRMERVESAAIRVEREVYSGVRVRIGEMTLLLEEDTVNATFRMGEDGIVY